MNHRTSNPPERAGRHEKRARKPARKPTKIDVAFTLLMAVASLTFMLAHDADAEAIHVERFGLASGDPILLIPGLSCGGDVWRGTVEALAADHDLHVLTLAGFAGEPPLDGAEPFLRRVRDAIAAYVEDQDLERPTLVGHSLGGFLAYWVASEYPDRVGAVVAVDGLPFLGALQSSEATAESTRAQAEQMRSTFAGMTAEQFRGQNEMALRTMIRDVAEIARVAATSGDSDPATVGRAIAELMTVDLRADLAKITVPVLQFGAFGGLPSDELRRVMADRYREQIAAAPDARFVEAPTLHFVMLDDPDFFVAQLRGFLAEVRR